MTAIPVGATTPTSMADDADGQPDGDEIDVLDDLDDIASTEVMLGCGDDNPYK
jgi:hypothetical protein